MNRNAGHQFEFQDSEVSKFKYQSHQRHSVIDTIDQSRRVELSSRGASSKGQRGEIGKILHTTNAKSPEKSPIDRAAIRRMGYKKI